jgi:hypothetical protein
MKVTFDIDLTPEEARTLLGLPDVSALHDIYLDRMKTLISQGVTPDMVSDLVKSWGNMGGAGMALVQGLMGQMGSAAQRASDLATGGGRKPKG